MEGSGTQLVTTPGVLSVIKLSHKVSPKGGTHLTLVEEVDLLQVIKEELCSKPLPANFCRKDKETGLQRKFCCRPCRMLVESVGALYSHVTGAKHQANLDSPPADMEEFFLDNSGRWKKRKGEKRGLEEGERKLSKRERTKVNKIARNIPILAQHTEAKYDETETYFEAGLRKVRPYHFTFTTHAKGRWLGDSLYSVFSREFRALPPGEFEHCVQAGLVRVNGEVSSSDYLVKNNDFISHRVHRHELPVTEARIKVVAEEQDLVVVDKPSSIPVHPCGRYRHNTVLFILAKEEGLKNLHTVHRLDRLTSGVLIFSKSAAKAREMEHLIKNRLVQKEYVCRVVGKFPEETIVCDQPIEVISYKIGVCVVDPKGKESETSFKRLDYKDGVSVVRCMPKTGRMHQIRVHLQYLGFPIDNDPLYNSNIFGPEKGKMGRLDKTREQLLEDLVRFHTVENWLQSEEFVACEERDKKLANPKPEGEDGDINTDAAVKISNFSDLVTCEASDNGDGTKYFKPASEKGEATEKVSNVNNKVIDEVSDVTTSSPDLDYYDPHCGECRQGTISDPPPASLVMHLHALQYSGEGWTYKTDLPQWAVL